MISDIFRFQKTHKIQFVAPPIGGMTPLDLVLLTCIRFILLRIPSKNISRLLNEISENVLKIRFLKENGKNNFSWIIIDWKCGHDVWCPPRRGSQRAHLSGKHHQVVAGTPVTAITFLGSLITSLFDLMNIPPPDTSKTPLVYFPCQIKVPRKQLTNFLFLFDMIAHFLEGNILIYY